MSIQLEWNNELQDRVIAESWIVMLEELLQSAASTENVKAGMVSLSFVDNDTIQAINKQYRDIDRPTDVLSFAMQETQEDIEEMTIDWGDQEAPAIDPQLGDIIISVPMAIVQSEEYGHTLEREIGFLFVHGFLHLLGYDHQDDASESAMLERQEMILKSAGLTR